MTTADRQIRVLYVDADPAFADTVVDFLEHEDGRFDVETAPDAATGLERLATDAFDCVVADHDLPDRDGIAFLEAVRERFPDLPFILYTGQGSEDVASDAISVGVTEYLRKGRGPDQYATLADRIRDAVETARDDAPEARQDLFYHDPPLGVVDRGERTDPVHSDESDPDDRRKRSRGLDGAAERYRTLAEQFPNGGVHYFDDEFRYQSVSGEGFDAIETSPNDLVGNTIYEVESYSEAVVETLESLMTATLDGERDTAELRYEERVYRLHSAPIRDADGAITAGFFIAQDITERHRREQELQALSTAMRASIDGMAVLDENDEYAFVNQAHADIYGYEDPSAFRGETWRTCYGDDEVARFEDEIVPTLYERGNWRGEAIGTRKGGSTFPQELSLSITGDGRIICVVRDITERKERERELKRHNERLEKLVSTVSHDLRNPLTVAQGRLQLARSECDSDDLDSAAASIDRTIELVDELLTLARQARDVGDIEPVALDAVVARCWGNVATADATLHVELDRRIRADPSRLGQLLENLIRNAVEHGSTGSQSRTDDAVEHGATSTPSETDDAVEHGGDDVTVTVGELDDGFYVADDGPGIPADEREQVREPGYSTDDDGAGFGLSIVHDIVTAHGWTLSITESEAGGARFEITGIDVVE
jgi:PAS domain S-box-containing protein